MAKARARLLISGRVQGVFYRAFTEEVAQSFGVGGRVEALMEGEKESIGRAIEACYQGPPAAMVDKIDLKWEDFRGEYKSFSVRYF
jgi:acylphosphatase